MTMPPLDPGDVQDESGLMMYYTAEQVREHMEAAYRAGQVEKVRRAIAIAQAVDEWRPSPPRNDDFRQQVEADAKLMLMRRADELLSMDDQP
jgi:hypothetical protein